jgi:beta-glucosidase
LRLQATFEPATTAPHVFSLVQAGRARLLVDGHVVIDGIGDPMPRDPNSYLGYGSEERVATIPLEAGRAVEVVIEYSSRGTAGVYAVRAGCRAEVAADAMARAVRAAEDADVVIVVVGTDHEWESEGFDRVDMDLPGRQDELIEQVAAVNANTIVAVNTGAPVSMPWADAVDSVLQLWFGGQEMSNALADVVVGAVEPGGRLPTTVPLRLEHNPSYGNFPGEHDEVRYGEGLLVGYRWYESRHLPVRFPFGHGLSYTRIEIGQPELSAATFAPGDALEIVVPVANTGGRAGSEVVQCYVEPPAVRVTRPRRELKAFAKAHLGPGESSSVTLALSDRAFACWDRGSGQRQALKARLPFADMMAAPSERPAGWRIHPGRYVLHIGRSSAEIEHTVVITVTA